MHKKALFSLKDCENHPALGAPPLLSLEKSLEKSYLISMKHNGS